MKKRGINKKGQVSVFDIIAGAIILGGGAAVMLSYVNLGTFLASIGMVLEIVKLLLKKGVLS